MFSFAELNSVQSLNDKIFNLEQNLSHLKDLQAEFFPHTSDFSKSIPQKNLYPESYIEKLQIQITEMEEKINALYKFKFSTAFALTQKINSEISAPNIRKVFFLYFVKDFCFDFIAQKMNYSVQSVRRFYCNGIKNFVDEHEQAFFSPKKFKALRQHQAQTYK